MTLQRKITRFIGLDISARSTGVTILDRDNLTGCLSLVYVTHIAIPSSVGTGKNKIKLSDGERLRTLRCSLYEILERFAPQVFIKEGQGADMNKFRSVSLVSKATGVVEECCQSWMGQEPLEIHSYAPSTIKLQVAGKGNADKEEVQKTVFKMFGTEAYTSKQVRKLKPYKHIAIEYNDDETDSTASILTYFKKEGIDFHL